MKIGAPPVSPEAAHLDPMTLLAHIAAATSTIRLGANIHLLPLRHPIVTARIAMTVDVLSQGRLTLGIGVGWLEEGFRAVDIDSRNGGARTLACVRALKALWTESEPVFHGKHFSFGPVRFEPKPVQQPHPPIVFGGESDAALARAAALGDGWYVVGHTPQTVVPQLQKLRSLLAEAGRAGAPFEITVSHGGSMLGSDDVERYAAAGVDRVVVLPWTRGREADERLGRLAAAPLR